MERRTSGILMHVTSLPSPCGIGDLGPSAYEFASYLYRSGQSWWQVLPFTPIDSGTCYSPYSSASAFAGNRYLISPRLLLEGGLLGEEDLGEGPVFPEGRVNYPGATRHKNALLERAYLNFAEGTGDNERGGFEEFRKNASGWLRDHALFRAVKDHCGGAPWTDWPPGLRDREKDALERIEGRLSGAVEREEFFQFLFAGQWNALRSHCNDNGIGIIGDIPIYVSLDSADVWAHPKLFKLDHRKRPEYVAGVPPDYFSKKGQLWGNPVYRWEAHERDDYAWWGERLAHSRSMFDAVRIDHFRGFAAYWEVKRGARTAVGGRWVDGPGEKLFDALHHRFPSLPIIAEDLGLITDDVRQVMTRFGFPGMRVLQFGFGGDESKNPNSPRNIPENCLVYTGTHDNNTSKGWFDEDLDRTGKGALESYVGEAVDEKNVSGHMIRIAMGCRARTAIIPIQDVLGLGSEARMNLPGKAEGNWGWRMSREQLRGLDPERLRRMSEEGGRRRR